MFYGFYTQELAGRVIFGCCLRGCKFYPLHKVPAYYRSAAMLVYSVLRLSYRNVMRYDQILPHHVLVMDVRSSLYERRAFLQENRIGKSTLYEARAFYPNPYGAIFRND